ncbi:hypothetical protein O181_041191 [Austropuccinia psidii MF-1]|uniref:Uncharacterized protein n=1 Tax=Austropuccinia psidii MF-1 TaxID=1389203 RepID=A0A9Q3HE18_9BASI|nr:hypothetical protein [Austropuccinia psidii MF-1]
MEDIINRRRICKNWTRKAVDSKIIPKTSRKDSRPERPVLKCHKCGSILNLAKSCNKKSKINEAKVTEEVKCTEEKEDSAQGSEISEDTSVEDCHFENITSLFEVNEVHTHLQ